MTRTLAVLLVALFALSLAACDRVSQSALDLVVGDCFIEPATTDEVQEVQRAPCNEAHSGEVMMVGDYPDQDEYPGEAAFDAWVETNCLETAFEAYTGTAYADQELIELAWLTPTPEGWEGGDHEISCYVVPADRQPVNFSYRAGAAPAAS